MPPGPSYGMGRPSDSTGSFSCSTPTSHGRLGPRETGEIGRELVGRGDGLGADCGHEEERRGRDVKPGLGILLSVSQRARADRSPGPTKRWQKGWNRPTESSLPPAHHPEANTCTKRWPRLYCGRGFSCLTPMSRLSQVLLFDSDSRGRDTLIYGLEGESVSTQRPTDAAEALALAQGVARPDVLVVVLRGTEDQGWFLLRQVCHGGGTAEHAPAGAGCRRRAAGRAAASFRATRTSSPCPPTSGT